MMKNKWIFRCTLSTCEIAYGSPSHTHTIISPSHHSHRTMTAYCLCYSRPCELLHSKNPIIMIDRCGRDKPETYSYCRFGGSITKIDVKKGLWYAMRYMYVVLPMHKALFVYRRKNTWRYQKGLSKICIGMYLRYHRCMLHTSQYNDLSYSILLRDTSNQPMWQ